MVGTHKIAGVCSQSDRFCRQCGMPNVEFDHSSWLACKSRGKEGWKTFRLHLPEIKEIANGEIEDQVTDLLSHLKKRGRTFSKGPAVLKIGESVLNNVDNDGEAATKDGESVSKNDKRNSQRPKSQVKRNRKFSLAVQVKGNSQRPKLQVTRNRKRKLRGKSGGWSRAVRTPCKPSLLWQEHDFCNH